MDPRTDSLVPEAALATALGVGRDDLRKLRENLMLAGEHYHSEGRGKAICYTPTGQALLEKTLSDRENEAGRESYAREFWAAVEAATAPRRYCEMVIAKICHNPRVVICHGTNGGAAMRVNVRVKPSPNFRTGMVLRECVREHPGLFQYHGPLPRWRGDRRFLPTGGSSPAL